MHRDSTGGTNKVRIKRTKSKNERFIDRIVMHKTIKNNLHLFERILERLKLVTSMLLYVTEVFEGRKD